MIDKIIFYNKKETDMSKWAEIIIDFYHVEEEKWYVNAWKNDEEGTVIAKIDDNGNIEYLDEDAKYDEYAQDCINEFKEEGAKI